MVERKQGLELHVRDLSGNIVLSITGGDDVLCLYPVSINGQTVACGRCMQCRITRTKEWTERIKHELIGKVGCFLTLTYNDDNLPEGNTLVKDDLQKFNKRLRRYVEPLRIKLYGCGEYGERTNRPHYHLIVIGWEASKKQLYKPDGVRWASKEIEKLWTKGNNSYGSPDPASIGYVVGYIRKKRYGKDAVEKYDGRISPFALQSLGLGKAYALAHKEAIKNELFKTMENSKRSVIPRYYRRLLLDEEEQEAYRIIMTRRSEEEVSENISKGKNYYQVKQSDRIRRRKEAKAKAELYKSKKNV